MADDVFPRKGKCPFCSAEVEAATAADRIDPRPPKGGDVTLCMACGALGLFCDDGALRRPTEDEAAVLAADHDLRRLRFAWLMTKLELKK